MSEELVMDHRFDPIELACERQRDEAVQRTARAAEEAWLRHPMITPLSDCEPEPDIAALSAEETLDAMYRGITDVRLDLVYCSTISGDFRKRWANRLGGLNVRSAAAAAEIARLRDELAIYQGIADDDIDLDVAQIDHKLWRLRELCSRYQQLARSA
jgi:hypothetical protein